MWCYHEITHQCKNGGHVMHCMYCGMLKDTSWTEVTVKKNQAFLEQLLSCTYLKALGS